MQDCVDPYSRDRNNLQTFLCGGGSLNPFYKLQRSTYEIKSLEKPSNLNPDYLDSDSFNRISVANGLSYYDAGKFIKDEDIERFEREKTPHFSERFIEQP